MGRAEDDSIVRPIYLPSRFWFQLYEVIKWKSSAQFHGFTCAGGVNNNCRKWSLFKNRDPLISKTVRISISLRGLGVESFFLDGPRESFYYINNA